MDESHYLGRHADGDDLRRAARQAAASAIAVTDGIDAAPPSLQLAWMPIASSLAVPGVTDFGRVAALRNSEAKYRTSGLVSVARALSAPPSDNGLDELLDTLDQAVASLPELISEANLEAQGASRSSIRASTWALEKALRDLARIAAGLAAAGKSAESESIAASLAALAGNITDPNTRAAALAGAAEVRFALGDRSAAESLVAEAKAAINEIGDERARVEAWAAMTRLLISWQDPARAAEMVEGARRAAQAIEDEGARAEATASVARLLVDLGERKAALDAAIEAHDLANIAECPPGRQTPFGDRSEDDARFRDTALGQVARSLAVPELAHLSLAAAVDMRDLAQQAKALTSIAQGLEESGATDAAREAAGKARTAAEGVQDPEKRVEVLTGVAEALAATGDVPTALSVATALGKHDARSVAPVAVAKGLSRAAKAVASTGDAESAITVVRDIRDPAHAAEAFAEVAKVLALSGRPAEARRAASYALEARDSLLAYGGVTHVWFTDTLSKALASVAIALVAAGDRESAGEVAATAMAAVDAIDEPDWQASSLEPLAIALSEAGMADEALAAANAIGRPARRAILLARVGGNLALLASQLSQDAEDLPPGAQ